MSEPKKPYQTYKYRLYQSRKSDQALHQHINVAGLVWNHALALQKRYYRLTGKYIPVNRLKSHVAHLRMKTQRFAHWQILGSQSVQEVLERLDKGYQRFFAKKAKRPPKFKKVKQFSSFTLKQYGWSNLPDKKAPIPKGKGYIRGVGQLRIGQRVYKYVKHRPINGMIKTVQIKRDSCGRLWVCFCVLLPEVQFVEPTTGRAAGFDFGLKTFLTDQDGQTYPMPQFFRASLHRIKLLSRSVSRKKTSSQNHRQTRYLLNRTHLRVADQRRDYHYKLAHQLCKDIEFLFFENLTLEGMKRLWGRKVTDLGFAQFLEIMEQVAFKLGKLVLKIPRFERTTGKCSSCGHEQKLALHERVFVCEGCGLRLDRDHNAAQNILHVGASTYTGLGIVRPLSGGSLV